MSAAVLAQGVTNARDALKSLFSYVGVSTDQTAFNSAQTRMDPTGSATNLIQVATITNVDGSTFDATMQINGNTQFTNQQIWTISGCNGPASTNAQTRTVRGQPIGIQAGDLLTTGPRVKTTDVS